MIKKVTLNRKPLRSKQIIALPDSKQRVSCINRSFKNRDRYLIGAGEKKIYRVSAEEDVDVTPKEISTYSIVVTLSMFVSNKFIIAGRYYDEQEDDNLGILNIFNSDDENFVQSTSNQIFLKAQVNAILPLQAGNQALIG